MSGEAAEKLTKLPLDSGPAAEEAPVEIEYNGHKLTTLLCTPEELRELALGWLYTQGLIRGLDEVLTLGACDTLQKIVVQTAVDRYQQASGWRQVITSGCGGGSLPGEQWETLLSPIQSTLRVSLAEIQKMAKEMLLHAPLYQKTGGVHGAALAQDGAIVAQAEDIGRHNAVDKVIGKALLRGIDLSFCVLLATGRLSSEMALKAVQAGIPVVVSLSIPTTLAVRVAEAAGIALVGRAVRSHPFVYGNLARVRPT